MIKKDISLGKGGNSKVFYNKIENDEYAQKLIEIDLNIIEKDALIYNI